MNYRELSEVSMSEAAPQSVRDAAWSARENTGDTAGEYSGNPEFAFIGYWGELTDAGLQFWADCLRCILSERDAPADAREWFAARGFSI